MLDRSSVEASCEYRAAKLNNTAARSYDKFGKICGSVEGLNAGAYGISNPIFSCIPQHNNQSSVIGTYVVREFGQDVGELRMVA